MTIKSKLIQKNNTLTDGKSRWHVRPVTDDSRKGTIPGHPSTIHSPTESLSASKLTPTFTTRRPSER